MSLYFALLTVENNKNKKSVKFQGDMLNFCDFSQVFVFTRNHHLKFEISSKTPRGKKDSTKKGSREKLFSFEKYGRKAEFIMRLVLVWVIFVRINMLQSKDYNSVIPYYS